VPANRLAANDGNSPTMPLAELTPPLANTSRSTTGVRHT
jgi:hypothetical protein